MTIRLATPGRTSSSARGGVGRQRELLFQKLGLDVYVGEFERPPMAQLWSDRRMLITPHVSNGSDENRHGGVDVFCDNLFAYRDGRPLRNVIDWQRGY